MATVRTGRRHRIAWVGLILILAMFMSVVVVPPSPAHASELTGDMVDSFSMQVKRENTKVWEDLPAEGGKVGVYDMTRYHLGFHVPAGTLSKYNRTVTVSVLLDGDRNGWGETYDPFASPSKPVAMGRITMGGADCGEYKVLNPPTYVNDSDVDPSTGRGYRNLTITFTFNEDVAERNQTLALNDGQLYFDWNANRLIKPDPNVTVSVAGHDVELEVQAPQVALEERAVGEPDIDYTTGLVTLHWEADLENNGTLPLYAGWKLTDNLYELAEGQDAPADITDSGVGYWGFAVGKDRVSLCSTLLKDTGLTGDCWSLSGSSRPVDGTKQYFNLSPYAYNLSQLDPGKKVTLKYDTTVPIDTNPDRYVDRIVLNSDYAPTRVATAEQQNPASGMPSLAFSKKKVSLDNPDNCTVGDAGCRPRYKWEATITNTGEGGLQEGWQVIDTLSFSDWSNKVGTEYRSERHYYTEQDLTGMMQAVKDAGYENHLAQLYDLSQNKWVDITDNQIPDTGVFTDFKLTIDTPLPAGQKVPFTYYSHMDWTTPWSSTSTISSQYYFGNKGYGCGDINGNTWYCWPAGQAVSEGLQAQYLSPTCYPDDYDFTAMSKNDMFEYCSIKSIITNHDKNRDVTYHENMTVYWSQSTVDGFTLANTGGDKDAAKTYKNAWFVDAPHTIGDTVTDTTYAGASGRAMSITKTGEGEWDITFPGDWDWQGMGASSASNPLYRQIYLQYYPDDVKGWDTFQAPVWSQSSFDTAMGIGQTAHVTVKDGYYDVTSNAGASIDINPRSTDKGLVAQESDGARGTKATYRIHMNTMALDLNPDGDTVSLNDTMTLPDDASAQLMDVIVWATTGKTRGRANVGISYYGSPWDATYSNGFAAKAENKLDPSTYTTHYNPVTHTLTINNLPDNHQLAIEYHLRMNSTNDTIPSVTNTATIMVGDQPTTLIKPATSTNTIKIYESGAVIHISGIYLTKVDADDHSLQLSGAKYDITEWRDGAWKPLRDNLVTDAKTPTVIDKLECDRAYQLTETQAPVGYERDTSPYRFTLKGCDVTATDGIPAGWAGAQHLVMDTVSLTDRKLPNSYTMPYTGSIPWLYLLLGAGLASMLLASILLLKR